MDIPQAQFDKMMLVNTSFNSYVKFREVSRNNENIQKCNILHIFTNMKMLTRKVWNFFQAILLFLRKGEHNFKAVLTAIQS